MAAIAAEAVASSNGLRSSAHGCCKTSRTV
jgi:hypothetical protein